MVAIPDRGQLDGTIVIVTGAGRGMGRAMSRALLTAGATVVGVDRDGGPLDEVGGGLDAETWARRWVPMTADVSRPGTAETVVQRTLDVAGSVTALVNNAGLPKFLPGPNGQSAGRRPVWEVTPDEFELYLGVHTIGPFLLARAVVPPMLGAGAGRIITVTTNLHTMVCAGSGPYGPSKAAEESLTAILAAELDGTGVTANVLVPGGKVNTRPGAGSTDVAGDDLLQPDIMVPPLLWLLSDEAAGTTGRRFKAVDWSPDLRGDDATISRPIAWSEQQGQPTHAESV